MTLDTPELRRSLSVHLPGAITVDTQDLLRRPVTRLYRDWLARLQAEVAGYLSTLEPCMAPGAGNGHGPVDPTKVAAACPATGGREQVAAWAVRSYNKNGEADR